MRSAPAAAVRSSLFSDPFRVAPPYDPKSPFLPDTVTTETTRAHLASQSLLTRRCQVADSTTAEDGRATPSRTSRPCRACCSSAPANRPPASAARTAGLHHSAHAGLSGALVNHNHLGQVPARQARTRRQAVFARLSERAHVASARERTLGPAGPRRRERPQPGLL